MKIKAVTAAGVVVAAACAILIGPAFAQSKTEKTFTRDLRPEQRAMLAGMNRRFDHGRDTIRVALSADRHTYRIGETMTIGVEVNRNAYVYLFDIGTSGKAYLLFPNRFHRSARVRADRRVTVPGAHDDWSITVHGPAGREVVVGVASSKPIRWRERHELIRQYRSGAVFARIRRRNWEAARDLVIEPGRIKRGEARLKLRIVGAGR